MINFLKVSKKTGKQTPFELPFDDAKKFLFKLEKNDFWGNTFYFINATTAEETREFLSTFSNKFLVKAFIEEVSVFDIYLINEKMKKTDRDIRSGISTPTLERMHKKLKLHFNEDAVGIKINFENFNISLVKNNKIFDALCDYHLNIIDVSSEKANLTELLEVRSELYSVFRNTKYYYNRKAVKINGTK